MGRLSNKTSLAILLHSTVRFLVYSEMKFEIFSHINVFCLSRVKGVKQSKRGVLITLSPYGDN